MLELYDPDRSRAPRQGGAPSDWARFDAALAELQKKATAAGGKGLAFLLDRAGGPTRQRLVAAVQSALPEAKFYTYDPLSPDHTIAGAEMVFGPSARVHHSLDGAKVVVALDSNFLAEGPEHIRLAREFARGRSFDAIPSAAHVDKMNRLYAIEGIFSTTGAAADNRLRVAGAEMGDFLRALAQELLDKHGLALPDAFGGAEATAALKRAASSAYKPANPKFIPALAKDLAAHRGGAVLLVGERQPPAVHAFAHLLNAALGAFDGPAPRARVTAPVVPSRPQADAIFAKLAAGDVEGVQHWAAGRPTPHMSSTAELKALTDALNKGQVETLVVIGANPVYTSPAALGFKAAMAKAKQTVVADLFETETAQGASWHMPLAHPLESWGDALAWDGTPSIVQPLIAPLHGARSGLELLASFAGIQQSAHALVRETWMRDLGTLASEKAWRASLHSGVIPDSARRVVPVTAAAAEGDNFATYVGGHVRTAAQGAAKTVGAAVASSKTVPAGRSNLDIAFVTDAKLLDGRYANVSWLQEMPHPVTKLVWDNALIVGPTLARELGVKSNVKKNKYMADLAELTVGSASVTLPVFVLPGMAPYSVQVALGYGRTHAGVVGNGFGVDVSPIRPADGAAIARGSLTLKGGQVDLCSTQDHFSLDWKGEAIQDLEVMNEGFQERRPVAMVGTAADYKKNPAFAKNGSLRVVSRGELVEEKFHEEHPAKPDRPLQMTGEVFPYDGMQWGMTIDMTACTGCNACVIACQSENNIPSVGREQVFFGREMHWIRLDRYFVGDVDEPEALSQPVNCLQCENAPCEPVCPVAATVHDSNGINGMVYNRCIGTRYCANNCPAKVRRFNYFDFTKTAHLYVPADEKERHKVLQLQRNPNVTVRFRGVMEKCTYCVQRVQEAIFAAKRNGQDGKKLPDGAVTPACAQTCPTEAIVFGDINDPKSRVAARKHGDRNFEMLSELNIRPRTTYLAKIRNPNPEIA